VYTSLLHEARPCIKYSTGDIVKIERRECPGCGKKMNRFAIVGRADDMVIIRGVNVHPEALKEMVERFMPIMNGEMRLMVPGGTEVLRQVPTLKVEMAAELDSGEALAACRSLEEQIQDVLRIRVTVAPVARGSLATAGRKSQLVERTATLEIENEGKRS
jgi:phenylacetate-CoA ligase